MGEVNADGMVLDVSDEIIGYVDFGHGTLKNKTGSHFATVQSDGAILDRNELNRGELKNFTYHKMKIFASYVFFFDGKLLDDSLSMQLTSEGEETNQAAATKATTSVQKPSSSSVTGVDTSSIGVHSEEDSMSKEEARLLRHVKGAKATAPTTTASSTTSAAVSTAKPSASASTPKSSVSTSSPAASAPVSSAASASRSVPSTTSSSASSASSGPTSSAQKSAPAAGHQQHAPAAAPGEPQLDERGLVADSDEKARREMERMNRLMGGSSSTTASSTSSKPAVSQHDVMAQQYPIPKRAEVKSKYEVELWTEINKARSQPQQLISHLESMKPNFDGKAYHYPGTHTTRMTQEGSSAIDGALAFLRSQKPLEAISLSDGLSHSCKDLVTLAAEANNFDNLETDDQGNARFNRYGKWSGKLFQNLALGNLSPAEVVLSWIVDDGNASRDHRHSIYNADIHFVGISTGPHIQFGRTIVACFTSKYTEDSATQGSSASSSSSSSASGAAPSHTSSSQHQDSQPSDGIPVVSQESEYKVGPLTESGNKYYLDISNLGCPVNGLEVKLLENGRQLTMSRTIRVNGMIKESIQRMKLPFQLVASQVQPEFHASTGILTINFMKASSSSSSSSSGSSAMEIGTFTVPAWPGNPNDKVSVQATSSTDAYIFSCEPSKHATKVSVSIDSDKKLTFDMQYTFDTVVEGQPATKTVKMSSQFGLPFEVAREQVSMNDNGDKGSSVKILKNKPSEGTINQPDAVIPIQSK